MMRRKQRRLNPVNFGKTLWEFRVLPKPWMRYGDGAWRGDARARYYGRFVRESNEHVCAQHEQAIVPEVACTRTIKRVQLDVPFGRTSFPI